MQKKIFSLLVLLMTAVSGAWATDSHWPDFNSGYYGGQGVLVAAIQIDGVTITSEHEGWDALEIAFFVGDECRGNGYYLYNDYVEDYGDPFPIIDGAPIFYDNADEQVSVIMYDHINGILYEDCVVTYNGEPLTILTGDDHFEGWDDPDNPVFLNFTSPAAPATTTNYYLVGTMNDWGASKQFLLTQNPGNAAEYMITLNLKADTQLKVIGVDAQNNATWYPSGDNYYVNTAGQYTVYFRPDGQGGEGWHYGCIYLAPAPAPAVPLTDLGSGQWQFQMPDYAVVAKIEYDTELELLEENVNTAVLADWDGYEADITLQRKLVAGSWNTLAVPFNVSSQMLGYLTSTYGMSVKQLASTSLENDGKTLMLNFENATEMVAGTPYLVKVSTDYDFSARALPNVEVSQELHPVTSTYIDFIPTLGKTTIEGVDAENVLFIATGNKLKNPSEMPAYMKGFRAYFQLKGEAAQARSFSLNLGEDVTGISLTPSPSPNGEGSDYYTIDGRKLQGQPTNKGVYIVNGKKVIIK